MRLIDAIAALGAKSFERLCRRQGVAIDERKRFPAAEQAARQLAESFRAPADLPAAAQSALRFLASHGQGAPRSELGGGVLPLIERDMVFDVPSKPGQVAMPSAFRVQLAPSKGEDRASLRALLSVANEETRQALGQQLLGRRPTGPIALHLGDLLDRLESEEGLAASLAELSPKQRRLVEAIEARGAQLETDELLELERSPARVRLRGGSALPSSSASLQLSVRGLLLARARGLWVVPSEVAERVGASRRAAERVRRRELLDAVTDDEDLSPTRATLADDPTAVALALIAELRAEGGIEGRLRRSAVEAAARRIDVTAQRAHVLVALARDAGAKLERARVADVGSILFARWRDGAAWDEARRAPDAHRARVAVVEMATPTAALRSALLELLLAMPEERFAPLDELVRATLGDLRNAGAPRILARAATRHAGAFQEDAAAIVGGIAESLAAIGAADRAEVGHRTVLRLSKRGRRWMTGEPAAGDEPSAWDGARLRVGGGANVRETLLAARCAIALPSDRGLSLRVERERIEHAVALGIEASELRDDLERLAEPLPDPVERAFAAAATARHRVRRVPVSALLLIDDPDLLARIGADEELRELVLARDPVGGLLVREGVGVPRLARALARVGAFLDTE